MKMKTSIKKKNIRPVAKKFNSTTSIIRAYSRIIRNPQVKKQTIAFIKAVNGKKIRNTSGI